MDKYFFNCRAQSKKKRKSKKKEQENDDLPPINFKSSKKGFNLNESLRGYRSLTDEEQNTSQHLLRVADNERDLSSVTQKRGAYQPLTEEQNQELVDEMFGDSPEKSRQKSSKRQRKRRPREDNKKLVA